MSTQIRWMAALFFVAVLSGCASQAAEPRSVIDLNGDWKFVRADRFGAAAPEFDDSSWEAVTLPHTWNNLDGEDGGDNYYRGAGWYRRHLTLDADSAGKSLFLKFDGASSVTDVFVNGKPAGRHKGMFGAFCFDVTGLMNTSGDNVLAVRADNGKDPDVPPNSADFTFFGGIYRSVHLLVLNPLSITPLDDASSGVYVKQAKVSADAADLEITTQVRNGGSADKSATVSCELLDVDGKSIGESHGEMQVGAAATAAAVQQIHVDHPHLWNGRKDPYLYQMQVTVSDRATVVDRVVEPVGLRFFSVDPDKGFFLNGQSYPLHGVNRHQDRIDQGWAISPAEHEEDFKLIMEMGCTGIRLSHYQHAQEFYDLCDRGGLIVWAEACLVNSVTVSKEFDDTTMQQLRELIKQNYNHPSICFWSLFNELRDTGGRGGAENQRQAAHQIELVTRLNDLAHQLDGTRLTVGATLRPDPKNALNVITDVIAFNFYNGWYTGTPADWPHVLDRVHSAIPQRGAAMSEYGAGASIFQHEFDPKQPKTAGPWHPEEWQCTVHEAAYAAMKDRPWLWGTFLWSMFDFASDGRNEGDHPGRNDKGLVTYDRKTKKDAFYFYKANWSDESFVYVTDRRFTPRDQQSGPVKIYSNCDSVELKVNGESIGSKTSDNHIFIWPDVQLKLGDNKFETIGTKAGQQYTDAATIVYDPAAHVVRPTTTPSAMQP
jgi:beta-galactosidase